MIKILCIFLGLKIGPKSVIHEKFNLLYWSQFKSSEYGRILEMYMIYDVWYIYIEKQNYLIF